MRQNSFSEKCYLMLRKVPKGKVTTYKLIARSMGTRAYRAVGNAMNRNPHVPLVPCHRVVKNNSKIGGFALGKRKKIEMLKQEGIEIRKNRIVDFERRLYKF